MSRRPFRTAKVFGSAIVRIVPDIASIVVGVSSLEQKPAKAFAAAKQAAHGVSSYLRGSRLTDVGSSRIMLEREFKYVSNEQRFMGYRAKIGFNVILRDMNRVEEILSGLIDAGANDLTSVTFQTSQLKEVRADARRRAISAAREKAELYCSAAGVRATRVLAIEDINPELLSGRSEGHSVRQTVVDDTGDAKAMDPAAITIGAAVNVIYELEDEQTS